MRVLFIFGTRPEAIKLSPVLLWMRRFAPEIDAKVCVTAQHRGLLDQVLRIFDITPDYDLDLMRPGQTLSGVAAGILSATGAVIEDVKPALTVVQGDTTTTLCGALASFYARVPVAHVEAGLRSYNRCSPFPEEMNRLLTGRLADLHFAATELAAENLKAEGVDARRIHVTGNTGIDAVLEICNRLERGEVQTGVRIDIEDRKKLIVVTTHRRENFGDGMGRVCRALAKLAERSDVQIVLPMHPNPNVTAVVGSALASSRVSIIEPLGYLDFVDLMRRAYMLISDSGGIQEEAPSLGKPVLVMRENTERPEAVMAGTAKLVGTDEEAILREASRLLDDAAEYDRMSRIHNPYGDGRASERITAAILALPYFR